MYTLYNYKYDKNQIFRVLWETTKFYIITFLHEIHKILNLIYHRCQIHIDKDGQYFEVKNWNITFLLYNFFK